MTLEQENNELHKKLAEMEGDISATVLAFLRILKSFNINPEDFTGDEKVLMRKLPGLLNQVSRTIFSGGFDGIKSDFQSLAPILEKYKHLMPTDEQ